MGNGGWGRRTLERRVGDGSEDADGARTAQASPPTRTETGIAMGARDLGFWYSLFFPHFCRASAAGV
jgi:hypothetical protein